MKWTAVFIVSIVCLLPEAARAEQMADDSLEYGESSRILVLPFFIRSPETGWGGGLATAYFFKANKKEKDLRTSDINLLSLYTQRKQLVLVLGLSAFSKNEINIYRFQTSYSYYPDKTWGLGNYSEDSALEYYNYKQFFFNPQYLRKLAGTFYLGINYEYQTVQDVQYDSGGVLDLQSIPGRKGGVTSGTGMLLSWDTRNNAYSPSRGFLAEVNFTSFSKITGSGYTFSTLLIDTRKFIPIRINSVLGLQGYFKFNTGNTPIRNLAQLGGPEMMRGYYKGRYADKSLLSVQAEWRQYLFWRIGVVGFIAAGEVAHNPENFSLQGLRYTYGTGIRIMMNEKEKLNLRVDFGFGKNTHAFYVMLKEAF
ncbi:MAG: BamA/TamA family outer membrane protein [Bacteroidia bacterium]|nr:BamA/TamA family outer membrane protein [Bacteroidia bacterium]